MSWIYETLLLRVYPSYRARNKKRKVGKSVVGFERIGLTRSRERNFSQPRLPTWPMRAGEGGVVLVQGVGEDIAGDEFPAQFTTHFERPGRLYYLLASGRGALGALGARGVGGALGVGGRALSLSLSLFPRFLCQPNRRTAPSVAFYPTSRIVRVPLSRGEPLASFSLGASFFRACYDFFSFLFFFLSEVILCATNLPVGCVLGGVLCRYLSPPPARNYSVVSRIFIARTSLHFPGGGGKIPFMQFFKLPSIFIPRVESPRSRFANYSRLSLSFSLQFGRSSLFFFFAPIKARCLHFSISPRIFLHRYSYITL